MPPVGPKSHKNQIFAEQPPLQPGLPYCKLCFHREILPRPLNLIMAPQRTIATSVHTAMNFQQWLKIVRPSHLLALDRSLKIGLPQPFRRFFYKDVQVGGNGTIRRSATQKIRNREMTKIWIALE